MIEEDSIIPASLSIQALRHTGYKNTTYALAELIDNSIQANAENIEILCYDRIIALDKQERRTIHQIAVADDGTGMDEYTLKKSVQFGNGTRLHDRSGIGRFGMGLPQSTVSQCKRADIYTWSGGETPLHSYLSYDEIVSGKNKVPPCKRKDIDDVWKRFSKCLKNPSGTIVIWSKLDQVNWKKSDTVITKSEQTIGRIYRNLIHSKKVDICAISFMEDSNEHQRYRIKSNDPGYLISPSATPEPYGETAMFVEYADETMYVDKDGKKYPVYIKFSMTKDEARTDKKGGDGGNSDWGKHAHENRGISLIRADRELDLDTNMVRTYDPKERWWGVEVTFPPELDEVFGVTNTKQHALNFARLAKSVQPQVSKKKSNQEQQNEDHDEEGNADLFKIIKFINKTLIPIRSRISEQKIGSRTPGSKEPHRPEDLATDVTKERQEGGHVGKSDEEEKESPEIRTKYISDAFGEDGYMTKKVADEEAQYIVDNKLKFKIMHRILSGSVLFDVQRSKGVIIVKLNQEHPAYHNLMDVLKESQNADTDNVEELKSRLRRAHNGLELMFLSWARFEDEELDPEKVHDMQDLRNEWGKYLADFLRPNT